MFLIVGYEGDGTTRHVCSAARSQRADFEFLDLGSVLDSEQVSVDWSGSRLVLGIGAKTFDFGDYSAFYSRLYFQPTGNPLQEAALSEVVSWASAYLDQSSALVINRPGHGWSNFTKLLHTWQLRDIGFRVPESVITAVPLVARQLVATRRWVSKPCSGMRSESVLVDGVLRERLGLIERAPTQFQEYVEGADVRVHWLRGECFPLEIRTSSGIDYRFGDGHNEFSEVEVPRSVAQHCAAFCERAKLEFAGFDFKVDANAEWVALEANPMPGFDYYDRKLGGKIAHRLIEVLSRGSVRHEPFIEQSRRPALRSPFGRQDMDGN